MTGRFSEKDPERCVHYASFMSHLTLAEANLLFWLLFLCVILFLCIASVQHHKSIALSAEEKDLPKTDRAAKKRRSKIRRLRLHYLSIASLCAVLSVVCTVFEVFALFSVEFCGGEDLMMLYWGFWSVLQVGSNIAIFGVMLQFWIVLGDVETPSWAVALGTPVLVFAALGFVLKALWAKAWTRCRTRKGETISRARRRMTSRDQLRIPLGRRETRRDIAAKSLSSHQMTARELEASHLLQRICGHEISTIFSGPFYQLLTQADIEILGNTA